MRESYREERRKYQQENYKKNCELREQGMVRTRRKKTEVYPIKQEEDILAIQRYLLTHGRVALRPRNHLFFVLGISLGRRGGDIAKLKWGDILDDNGNFLEENVAFIREEKTGKVFNLYCNSTVRTTVRQYLDATGMTPIPSDYIFKSQIKGEDYVGNDRMCCIIKAAAKAVGVKQNIGTHSLRKTFGYRVYKELLSRGYNGALDMVCFLLNHSSIVETIRYIGIQDEMKIEACEAAAAPTVDYMETLYSNTGYSSTGCTDRNQWSAHSESYTNSDKTVTSGSTVEDNVIPFPSLQLRYRHTAAGMAKVNKTIAGGY